MEVMSLTHNLCLVIILGLCHYVALESSETEEENVHSKDDNFHSEDENVHNDNSPLLSSHPALNTPATFDWPSGIVPYFIEPQDYDHIIVGRIRAAMDTIERSSCVVFKDMKEKPPPGVQATIPWLSIQNPEGVRECSHWTLREEGVTVLTKAILVLGYDCMQSRDILHALLHALGLRDEVTHPQRDLYIRIIWENIQPKYRSLFWMRTGDTPHKMVEYDSMSIMHFHDRAYSVNGGATILPLISGLMIAPLDKLSQLDVMKLRLAFGHECNRRKVVKLLETCQNVLQEEDDEEQQSGEESEQSDEESEQSEGKSEQSGEESENNDPLQDVNKS